MYTDLLKIYHTQLDFIFIYLLGNKYTDEHIRNQIIEYTKFVIQLINALNK